MKRIIVLAFVLIICLCSCGGDYIEVSGESSKATLSHLNEGTLYFANTKGLTYHYESCYVAKRIKEENLLKTYELEYLTARGYKACKICIEKQKSAN